ncbi:MAG: hypothetical protein J1D77_08735 [Muribaculaceae bacterium]|nr:hypothetical protein [Muribaculaceae bacterium]
MGKKGLTQSISDFCNSLASLAKVCILSRGASLSSSEGRGREIIIIGNGPSFSATLAAESDWLLAHDLMCVNFAALTPEFLRLRPRYYILADAHFFNAAASDPNVGRLWQALKNVSWDMTLLIPSKFKHLATPLLMDAGNIHLRYFNLTPVEGLKWFSHFLFSAGLGMPRPRNVLIPAIMEAIRLGFQKIYLCGADHSWTKTLDVDKENFVVSIQPHFYQDNEEEHRRVRQTYKGLRLHDVLGSMTIAFKSYWDIADYARKKKIEIINATPSSMIDAFPRKERMSPANPQ